jgi:hypothetical protein
MAMAMAMAMAPGQSVMRSIRLPASMYVQQYPWFPENSGDTIEIRSQMFHRATSIHDDSSRLSPN